MCVYLDMETPSMVASLNHTATMFLFRLFLSSFQNRPEVPTAGARARARGMTRADATGTTG